MVGQIKYLSSIAFLDIVGFVVFLILIFIGVHAWKREDVLAWKRGLILAICLLVAMAIGFFTIAPYLLGIIAEMFRM